MDKEIIVKFKRLHDNAVIPTIATPESAAFDLYAVEDHLLYSGTTWLCKLGFAIQIPEGYCMKISPRSGLALKGLTIINSPGIVDSDYRKEVGVILHLLAGPMSSFLPQAVEIKKGERIAQARIERNVPVSFQEVEELNKTERVGGFGSTGK